MAIIKVLDVAFTGDGVNAPKLTKIDKIECDGSLFLIDPTHPYAHLKSDSLTTGDSLKNLLSNKLLDIAGGGLNVDATVSTVGSSKLKMERTSKGGIHGMLDQPNITSENYKILFPPKALDYINTHKEHQYYFSLWQRTTRKTTYTDGNFHPTYMTLANSTSAGNFILAINTNGMVVNNNLGINCISPKEEINHLFSVGVGSGAKYTISEGVLWGVGKFGAWNGSGNTNSQDKLPSQIFYRSYMEDLTVSGRTYEEVMYIDNQLYTKEVLTVGGRYYGDTFTDPYTIAYV